MSTPRERIRVCLVTQRWAPRFSGAAHRFRQYLRGLGERGIAVGIVCSSAPSESSSESFSRWRGLRFGDVLRQDDVEEVPVFRLRLPAGRSLRRNLLFDDALAKHLRMTAADVVQFLTLEPLRIPRASCTARTNARGVYTGTLLATFSKNPVKRGLQRQWIRRPIQRLDHVVVSSTVMGDFYRSVGVTTPISVIPNGVDLERFRSESGERARHSARESLAIPVGAQVVLFVGSIIHRKGVDLLLTAFEQVASANPVAELILVGPRDESSRENARAFQASIDGLARASRAAERIRFTGYVSAVDPYLRSADVLVLPSRHEGMGNVVLEAMAVGVPTILTPYLGLPAEFGSPGVHYVLSDSAPSCLAMQIQSLLGDPARRRSVARNGRRWVEEHMSISRVIDAYAAIYQDLAAYGKVRPCNLSTSWID